jgi:hypothetical protein
LSERRSWPLNAKPEVTSLIPVTPTRSYNWAGMICLVQTEYSVKGVPYPRENVALRNT